MRDKVNLSKCFKPTWQNAPRQAGQGRKHFQAWNIHVQLPVSAITSLLHIPLFWHKQGQQTDHLDFSLSYETTLLLTVPLPFIPLTVRLGENHRLCTNYATGSAASFKNNMVVSTMFLKTSTGKGPTLFTQSILEALCTLTTRKIFLNLLFLATYSAYYFYSTHCRHWRFFFLICQTSSCSPPSFKVLILSFSFYSCWGLLQYFSQIFGVMYLQVRGRKFPLEPKHQQAVAVKILLKPALVSFLRLLILWGVSCCIKFFYKSHVQFRFQ